MLFMATMDSCFNFKHWLARNAASYNYAEQVPKIYWKETVEFYRTNPNFSVVSTYEGGRRCLSCGEDSLGSRSDLDALVL